MQCKKFTKTVQQQKYILPLGKHQAFLCLCPKAKLAAPWLFGALEKAFP